MAAKLAVALVASSVLAKVLEGLHQGAVFLTPQFVLTHWMLWQPATYVFLEPTPWGILFGGLIVWSIGGALEMTWGSLRLLWYALGTTVAAGVLTVLLALILPGVKAHTYFGGMVMTTVLWVGFGLSHGRSQTNFWGMPLSGNALAAIGAGFVLLNGLFQSWYAVVPELFGMALAFWYVRIGTPKLLLLRFQSWRLQQRLKGRSKHLRVISRDRNMPDDSDRFLH